MIQLLLSSLAVGALYGALGIAFVVVHRMTGMINFATGDVAVAGGFGAVVASAYLPPLGAIAVGGISAALVSMLMYVLAIHPLRNRNLLVQTIVTLGVGIVIRSALQLAFGTAPHQFAPITDGDPLRIFGAAISLQSLWVIGITVIAYLALTLFFSKTMTGKAMSASAINRYAAGIVGVNLTLMALLAFGLAGAVAGVVISAQVPSSFITVSAGFAFGLKGFIAAILGGFDKPGLTLLGGFLIAFVEALASMFISTTYATTILFALLIILLIVRPQGLTRKLVTERV